MADHKKIFINFRRNNTGGWASLLYERLNKMYKNEVFFDENIKFGDSYPDVLTEAVENCKIFLAVIGPDWDQLDHINVMKENKEDWVRHEICLALQQGKKIIPIFVGRETKGSENSDEISSIFGKDILKNQGNILSGNTVQWDAELGALQNHIYEVIKLSPSSGKTVKSYENHICAVNRSRQFNDLKYGVENGKALFAVSGRNDIEIEHFTKRYLLLKDQKANPKYLNWECFCETIDKDPIKRYSRRESNLYNQIAEALDVRVDNKKLPMMKQLLQQRLNDQASAFAFLCVREGVSGKDQNSQDVVDWWEIWSTLLGSQQKLNTIVVLYTIPGLKGHLKILSKGKSNVDIIQLVPFGKITKDHIKQWYRSKKPYLPNIDLDKDVFNLFHFGLRRSYVHVNKHLEKVLITAENKHVK